MAEYNTLTDFAETFFVGKRRVDVGAKPKQIDEDFAFIFQPRGSYIGETNTPIRSGDLTDGEKYSFMVTLPTDKDDGEPEVVDFDHWVVKQLPKDMLPIPQPDVFRLRSATAQIAANLALAGEMNG